MRCALKFMANNSRIQLPLAGSTLQLKPLAFTPAGVEGSGQRCSVKAGRIAFWRAQSRSGPLGAGQAGDTPGTEDSRVDEDQSEGNHGDYRDPGDDVECAGIH